MSWVVILLLIGLLTINELLGAHYGTAVGKLHGKRWLVYSIYFLMIMFVFVLARQIDIVLKKL